MNENQESVDLQPMRRSVRWLLVALVFSTIVGVVSLFTGIASFQSHSSAAGTVTTFTYHTLTSRIVLSAGTLFHAGLTIGLLLHSHRAWRAAVVLPALWILLFAVMNFPLLSGPHADWSLVIPLVFLAGMAVWQTIAWRRQWALCEPLFRQ